MSEPVELIDVWRRSLEATVRFYSTIGELAVDYLQSLISSVTTLDASGNSSAPANGSAKVPASHSASITKQPQPISTMVLEACEGTQAVGVFLVENLLARPVTASPSASDFLGEDGRRIKSSLIFHPASVTLAPGEQILVRALATFGKNMKPGVRYQGEISVPGLLGTSIPLVLCKTETSGPPEASVPTRKRGRTGKNGSRSRPKTTKKRAKR